MRNIAVHARLNLLESLQLLHMRTILWPEWLLSKNHLLYQFQNTPSTWINSRKGRSLEVHHILHLYTIFLHLSHNLLLKHCNSILKLYLMLLHHTHSKTREVLTWKLVMTLTVNQHHISSWADYIEPTTCSHDVAVFGN